jgi:hypothetical protein
MNSFVAVGPGIRVSTEKIAARFAKPVETFAGWN